MAFEMNSADQHRCCPMMSGDMDVPDTDKASHDCCDDNNLMSASCNSCDHCTGSSVITGNVNNTDNNLTGLFELPAKVLILSSIQIIEPEPPRL